MIANHGRSALMTPQECIIINPFFIGNIVCYRIIVPKAKIENVFPHFRKLRNLPDWTIGSITQKRVDPKGFVRGIIVFIKAEHGGQMYDND